MLRYMGEIEGEGVFVVIVVLRETIAFLNGDAKPEGDK